MNPQQLGQGAHLASPGVRYSAWAPGHRRADVEIFTNGGVVERVIPLLPEDHGFFRGTDPQGRAGDRFKLRLDGAESRPFPGSRYQPEGVHGPSCVVDTAVYKWHDAGWQRPAFRDLAIYELHLGTFTPAGTFRGAIERLSYLRDLGINAIELMPVADFPGERNWGYDGVQLYAPARCYGTPDDLRALIDAAHQAGIAVILDVVYNHLGPDGNYLPSFSSCYFSSADHTPWGDAINFGHEQSQPVRDFYRQNVEYWMDDFHFDGFRLDATHAIVDASRKHILQELAEAVHARGGYIIAEDERNESRLVTAREEGGYGFDAVWADDFHHTLEVSIIEHSVYGTDFQGELSELVTVLEMGWLYSGQPSPKRGEPRGTAAEHLPPERFVFCISNHDQVGNRALGERLNHLVDPATYRAASALLLLSPYTPLLFMGQEWAASTPFQYFTDHHEKLGRLVEEGRRREFKTAFSRGETVPSPQARETFLRSKLRWEEQQDGAHAPVLELYRALLHLRCEHPEFRPKERGTVRVAAVSGVLALRVSDWLFLCDLKGGHAGALTEGFLRAPRWRTVLSTNETRFGGNGRSSFDAAAGSFDFTAPEALLLRVDTSGA